MCQSNSQKEKKSEEPASGQLQNEPPNPIVVSSTSNSQPSSTSTPAAQNEERAETAEQPAAATPADELPSPPTEEPSPKPATYDKWVPKWRRPSIPSSFLPRWLCTQPPPPSSTTENNQSQNSAVPPMDSAQTKNDKEAESSTSTSAKSTAAMSKVDDKSQGQFNSNSEKASNSQYPSEPPPSYHETFGSYQKKLDRQHGRRDPGDPINQKSAESDGHWRFRDEPNPNKKPIQKNHNNQQQEQAQKSKQNPNNNNNNKGQNSNNNHQNQNEWRRKSNENAPPQKPNENRKAAAGSSTKNSATSCSICPKNSFMPCDHLKSNQMITLSLANYKRNLSDYQGIDEEVLFRHHQFSKDVEIQHFKSSEKISSRHLKSKSVKNLDQQIEELYQSCFLTNLQLRQEQAKEKNKNKFKDAFDSSLSYYNKSMTDFFSSENDNKFFEKQELLSLHQSTKSFTLQLFQQSTNFKPRKNKNKNNLNLNSNFETEAEEEKEKFLSKLTLSIDSAFENIQDKNGAREGQFILRARKALSSAQDSYLKRIKCISEGADTEAELKRKEEIIRRETRIVLHHQTTPSFGASNFVQELHEELEKYMSTFFDNYFEVFKCRQEEDEATVDRVFEDAKVLYKKEMEQHFKSSKEFIPPNVLDLLHSKIMEKTIRKCQDEIKLTFDQEKKLRTAMKGLYFKYSDKNSLRNPMDSPAIGIDLGTTNSCVGIYRNGRVEIIKNELGSSTTPSYVSFKEVSDSSASASASTSTSYRILKRPKSNLNVIVGEVAQSESFNNPENTVFDAKRLIGRKFSDEEVQKDLENWPFSVTPDENGDDKPMIQVGEKTFHPEEISAHILKHMKEIAEKYLGKPVKDAVITVPALFNDGQRQATKDAGRIAGLNVLKIINEPTAAAMAYELHRTDDLKRNVLIFDLGGGTFDCAVLEMSNGEINVKAVHGDTHLGGVDFDGEMAKYCIEDFKGRYGVDLGRGQKSRFTKDKFEVSSRVRRMKLECETKKRHLSGKNVTATAIQIESIDQGRDLNVPFTRTLFETLNDSRFSECIKIVGKALEEAGMKKSEIDDIVLVGGSTRIPKIQEMLSEFFDGHPLSNTINPDEAVAYGAAIQACLLSGRKVNRLDDVYGLGLDLRVQDVTSFSLGIEVLDKSLSVIIPKNTDIPCSKSHTYWKVDDWQTVCGIRIYEGEDKKVAKNNNKLGSFRLEGVPTGPMTARTEKIDVTMAISDEGILNVTATVLSNQNTNHLTVIPQKKRMTEDEIRDATNSVSRQSTFSTLNVFGSLFNTEHL